MKDIPKKLIVDANIIFSALVKDSITRQLIIELPATLYAPDMLVEEIIKHKKAICRKTGLSDDNVEIILNKILSNIILINFKGYSNQMQRAYDIMREIDPDDTPYIALALSIKSDGIWSEDKDFEKQKIIRIWKTNDLIEKLK